ncbi:MAG: hypothetical protein IJZ79_02340 [Bacilli bacterium]|nr:hypothetical protein [Bacilli bacterium]
MTDPKMKNLIVTLYKKCLPGKNIICSLYTPLRTISLFDIESEDELHDLLNLSIDMVYVKSLLTDMEVEAYEFNFKNYVLKESESTIYILTKNKEVPIMY